jgi:hypothetical protein
MRAFIAFAIGFTLMLFFLVNQAIINKAMSADLAPPRIHRAPMAVMIPVIPMRPPERCLVTGEEPAAGQTLHVDVSCASKLRWVYER